MWSYVILFFNRVTSRVTSFSLDNHIKWPAAAPVMDITAPVAGGRGVQPKMKLFFALFSLTPSPRVPHIACQLNEKT